MVGVFRKKKIALYTIIIGACIKKKLRNLHKKKWIAEWFKRRDTLGSSMTVAGIAR